MLNTEVMKYYGKKVTRNDYKRAGNTVTSRSSYDTKMVRVAATEQVAILVR